MPLKPRTTSGARNERVPSGKTPPSGGPDTYDGRANTAAGTTDTPLSRRDDVARIVRWTKTT